jgi:hypothetical protein
MCRERRGRALRDRVVALAISKKAHRAVGLFCKGIIDAML